MIYESSNAYSFPHASKEYEKVLLNSEILKTPIIGKYEKNIIIKPKGGFHFNKEKKLKQDRPITPGPGRYNCNNEIFGTCTPKYSIGKKLKDIQLYIKKKIPGPGAYSITDENYKKTKGKKILFGSFQKEQKLKIINNKVPGVGNYDLTYYDLSRNKKNKYTIPKSPRNMDLKKEEELNENNNNNKIAKRNKISKFYNIKSFFGNEGTKPLLRGKPKDIKKLKTPGPGEYDIDKSMIITSKKINGASFGYGKKIDFEYIARKKNIPGPKYNLTSEFDIKDKQKIHAIKYTKLKKRNKKRFVTPAPGNYSIPCSFANTPLYSKIDNKFRKI